MDRRLFEAAMRGSVDDLHQLLKDEPLMLHGVSLTSRETPLHVASMAGNLNFAREMIRMKPKFAGELNQAGFSPMHIASANGYLEIVKELLKVNRDLCRLTSIEKRTAVHYAAIKGRVDVIKELVSNCAESIEDVTVRSETALHLAVKNNQFEAMRVMVETLKQLNKVDVLNRMDVQGNTVLHLATSRKQHQVVELLLDKDTTIAGTIEINPMNESSLTALDLLLMFPSEAGVDREIEEILRCAGAMRAREIISPETTQNENITNNTTSELSQSPFDLLVKYFKFQRGRDSPGDVRNNLLVIAVLIATATYQAGLSPPGGVWQDGSNPSNTNSTNATTKKHIEGKAILGDRNPVSRGLFLFFNSLGFHLSLFMIQILTHGFPLRLELQVCMIAMICTYNISISSISPNGGLVIMFHVLSGVLPLSIWLMAWWARLLLAKRRHMPSLTDIFSPSSA